MGTEKRNIKKRTELDNMLNKNGCMGLVGIWINKIKSNPEYPVKIKRKRIPTIIQYNTGTI